MQNTSQDDCYVVNTTEGILAGKAVLSPRKDGVKAVQEITEYSQSAKAGILRGR